MLKRTIASNATYSVPGNASEGVRSAGPERRLHSSTVGDTSPRDAFPALSSWSAEASLPPQPGWTASALSAKRSLSRVVELVRGSNPASPCGGTASELYVHGVADLKVGTTKVQSDGGREIRCVCNAAQSRDI